MFAVSNPLPSNLKAEAKKAAKILRDFTQITHRTGPDKLIPRKNRTESWTPNSFLMVVLDSFGFYVL